MFPFLINNRMRTSRRRGVALIVVLAMVAMIAILLAAFSGVMNTDRSASFSYSQSLRAEQMGKGCLELVVADLQNEMRKDASTSGVSTAGAASAFDVDVTYPKKPLFLNVTSANLLPQVTGTVAGMDQLVKISGTSPTYSGTGSLLTGAAPCSGTVLLSSTVSSATPSFNGRFVGRQRWNYPGFGDYPDDASTPKWIILTRGGLATALGSGTGAVSNAAPGNKNYAVGRFAYAVYDEGGLLDITVAGYPSGLFPNATALQALKGTLAGADLSKLGIDAQKLVQWRNAAHASGTADYVNLLTGTGIGAGSGYRQVAPDDTNFLSRQDLIQAVKSGSIGISGTVTIGGSNVNVLKYLTTFTRERNSPSWRPRNPVGLTPNPSYTAQALNLSSTNVFIPLVRYSGTGVIKSYSLDGSTRADYSVVAGDPVVYRRFPLDRIRWIGPSGPRNGATDDAIQTHFGLKWDSAKGVWHYYGPTGSTEQATIKTLNTVASEMREPNFFELLQAGILASSIGGDHHRDNGAAANAFNYMTTHERSKPFNLFRIGASIFSQYEESSNPVVISFATDPTASFSWQACGIENLPYLSMFHCLTAANTSGAIAPYLMIGLWNPHQGTVTSRPPIRIRGQGSVALFNSYARNKYPAPVVVNSGTYIGATALSLNTSTFSADLSSAAGVGINGFADPHAPLPTDLSSSLPDGTTASSGMVWAKLPAIGGTNYAGFRLPDFLYDASDIADTSVNISNFQWIQFWANNNTASPFNFWLEYQNPGGVWIPYNYHAGINDSTTWFAKTCGFWSGFMGVAKKTTSTGTTYLPASPQPIDPTSADIATSMFYAQKYLWETSDPRSTRFNYTQHQTSADLTWSRYLNSSIWSENEQSSYLAHGRTGQQVFQAYWSAGWNHAGLCRNNTTAPGTAGTAGTGAAYTDLDGIQRIADSGLFTSDPTTGNNWEGVPFAVSSRRTADRPIILNRPFYSVGELGYTNRDYPWRTLDFFSANSADAGLLDLFAVSASAENVLAGRVSLNTRNSAVLKSILGNTVANDLDKTPLSQPDQIAEDLVTLTGTGTGHAPLLGREEIATTFLPGIDSSRFGTVNSRGNSDEGKVKSRREATVRALADVAQTRTWNLMIDLVVQAGRYPASARSEDQFVVEGERRYWLHVAIDRFTGEVVDQQLEPVYQ